MTYISIYEEKNIHRLELQGNLTHFVDHVILAITLKFDFLISLFLLEG